MLGIMTQTNYNKGDVVQVTNQASTFFCHVATVSAVSGKTHQVTLDIGDTQVPFKPDELSRPLHNVTQMGEHRRVFEQAKEPELG